jgi:RIO-like serine/threonine protein kinase
MPNDTLSSAISPLARRRSFTRVAHFAAPLPDDLMDRLWTDPVSLLENAETLQRTGMRWTVRLTWASQRYVLKHYRPNWMHKAKQFVLPSRAWATWTATHKLADAGIATPRPVACIENRWGKLRRDSFLMYPYVEGRTLRSYFSREARESRSLADNLWQQLDDLWRRLEQLGASLADANTYNFIVCPAGRLWVIDLDKACFHRLAFTAARHQQRGWQKLLRSAEKARNDQSRAA